MLNVTSLLMLCGVTFCAEFWANETFVDVGERGSVANFGSISILVICLPWLGAGVLSRRVCDLLLLACFLSGSFLEFGGMFSAR